MNQRRSPLLTVVFVVGMLTPTVDADLCWGQVVSPNQKAASAVQAKEPPALVTYKGRTIARTMSYRGAGWLTRDEREEEERCSLLLTNLGIKPGMTVGDIGCGNGFYSLKMAQLVGDTGKVLAVDIQKEMLELLDDRASEAGIKNIELIQGKIYDPKLPVGKLDLLLLVDVYHEFSHPEQMLNAMRKSLKPDGVIVMLEYREEDPEVPIKPLHKMSKKQVRKELEPNGFKLVREFDRLPWQHMMFFGKDANWKPE